MRLLDISKRWDNLAKAKISDDFPRVIPLSEKFGNDDSVTLPRPLTVLFGLNGTGKTRLLKAISESLSDSPIIAMYELVNYLLHEFGKRDDIGELLDELTPLEPGKVRKSEVQDLVRRDYEEVHWYAVPILDSPFSKLVGEDVVPVFAVRHEGIDYDFRSMGLGELSAHLLMWILSYSKGSDNAAFLLDEPEAFLPAPSRTVLLAHLLETCLSGGKPLVVASHSLEVIQPALDADAAMMLTVMNGGSKLIGPSSDLHESVAGLFDLSPQVEWVFLLEDEAASILMQEIMRAVDPRLWQGSRFIWCKGYGDLEAIWPRLPRPSVSIEGVPQFAFVADGDKKSDVQKAVSKQSGNRLWPFFCLPGDPDELMKSCSRRQIDLLAQRFQISPNQLSAFFQTIQGREPHNWIEDVLKYANMPRQQVLAILSGAVVADLTYEQLTETISAIKS
ncbi:hypothetical protein [Streptomyces sp. NPDC056056]|uniref:hypothetical protein n=1 Tax=Streptomyces sp. NPDC056056 TaxID=3345698 RepID=UPI0035E03C28